MDLSRQGAASFHLSPYMIQTRLKQFRLPRPLLRGGYIMPFWAFYGRLLIAPIPHHMWYARAIVHVEPIAINSEGRWREVVPASCCFLPEHIRWGRGVKFGVRRLSCAPFRKGDAIRSVRMGVEYQLPRMVAFGASRHFRMETQPAIFRCIAPRSGELRDTGRPKSFAMPHRE